MAEPLHIGILIYPNVTQLDATGPAQVRVRAHQATSNRKLLPIPLSPVMRFSRCAHCT